MEVLLLFLVVIGTWVVEWIVKGAWVPLYFRVGIPLFKKSIRLSSPPDLSADNLNGRFEGGRYVALRFKQISLHEVAFREAFSLFRILFPGRSRGMSYTSIMHGLIRYDEVTRELHVIGFANLYPLLFTIVFIAINSSLFPSDGPSLLVLLFIVFPIGIFALGYFSQVKRYTTVFNTLSPENT